MNDFDTEFRKVIAKVSDGKATDFDSLKVIGIEEYNIDLPEIEFEPLEIEFPELEIEELPTATISDK
mgnify:FL=1